MTSTNGTVPPTQSFEKPNDLLKTYQAFQNSKLQQDKQIFTTQAEQLKSYESQVRQMRQLLASYKKKAFDDTQRLTRQIDSLNQQRDQHQRAAQQLKKSISQEQSRITSLRTKYVEYCKERIAIANTINVHALGKLQLDDRKSEAHDLFKWLIVTFYKEPVVKYYWDNFAEEVFRKDKGHDFKERVGKISSAELKEEERVSTETVIKNKDKLLKNPDLAPVKEEVVKFIKIAELVMLGFNTTKQSTVQEDAISKTKFEIKGKEQLAGKCNLKIGAIKDRMHISDHYIVVIEEIDNNLSNKQATYEKFAEEGQKIINNLETTKLREPTPVVYEKKQTPVQAVQNGETVSGETKEGQTAEPKESGTGPQGLYNTQTEKRDVCTCLMF